MTMVSYIGYHKPKCAKCRSGIWRWVTACGLLGLLLVTCIYINQSWSVSSRQGHRGLTGHIQTKMLVGPSDSVIHIPDSLDRLSGESRELEPISMFLNSDRKFSNSTKLGVLALGRKSLMRSTTDPGVDDLANRVQSDHFATVQSVPMIKIVDAQCSKLIEGNHKALMDASSHQHNNKYTPIQDMRYTDFTYNCDTFRRDRQYMMQPVSSEEEEFPIAYSIVMYKEVEQFERLLRAIYRPQNYYCIHLDMKSSGDVQKSVSNIARCFTNVFLASKSIDVQWGTYSVLEPEIVCMENLWKYKKWKYFINLTGQEFPLKTNLDIVKILKVFNGANSMEGTIKRRNKERTAFIHQGYIMSTQKKSQPPVPMTLSKGSVHITASRAFIDYVLHDPRALLFRKWIKDTGVPDESFFSSLNHSPQLGVPGAYKGEPETDLRSYPFITRFKNWGVYPFNWPCYGRRVRMICVFGIQDLKLLSERPELFANKFYLDFEPLAFRCLEELHYNRTREEIIGKRQFDVSFYENLNFVKNHI